jgi:hypothetical protein
MSRLSGVVMDGWPGQRIMIRVGALDGSTSWTVTISAPVILQRPVG